MASYAFGLLSDDSLKANLSVEVCAGTDNRSTPAVQEKGSSTKWPLLAVHMQMATCNTQEMSVVTCRQLQEEALHSTLVVPRENHTVGGGHGCRFSCREELTWGDSVRHALTHLSPSAHAGTSAGHR